MTNRRIVLGVTAQMSLKLLGRIPETLVSRGWEVHIVASPSRGQISFPTIAGVHFHPLRMRREISVLSDLVAFFRWAQLMKRLKPTVALVGTPKAGLLGILTSFLFQIPVRIYHLRGLRYETEFGARRKLLFLLEKFAARLATHVLAVSASVRNIYVADGACSQSKIHTIGEGASKGVDLKKFSPNPPSKLNDNEIRVMNALDPTIPVIGFVGRLSVDKGVRILADALRIMVSRTIPVQLLCVGPDEIAGSAQAELLSAGAKVIFAGEVDNASNYFKMMDILCLPSFREGFPNVILEAQASGVPVISSNATGSIDAVQNNVTGLLYEKDSPRDLVNAVLRLLGDAELQTTLVQTAYQRVVTHYSDVHIASLTADFLERRSCSIDV